MAGERISADEARRLREGEVLDAAFEMASCDVLTAWRVRNAALAAAASFVHPGPDWEDEQARKRLVREWVSDGHDQVDEENRQRTQMLTRMSAAEASVERLEADNQRLMALTEGDPTSIYHEAARYRAALERIAKEDYRGPRPESARIAAAALSDEGDTR